MQEAYKQDGIKWEPITYTDNSAIIEICDGTQKGIYVTLDSVALPSGTLRMLHPDFGLELALTAVLNGCSKPSPAPRSRCRLLCRVVGVQGPKGDRRDVGCTAV